MEIIGFLVLNLRMFMLTNPVYRAIVTYSSTASGEIKVRIPALTGLSDTVPISKVGRTAYNGTWPVPSIGSQIVVTADDDRLNNVFWVQVSPDAPTSLATIQAQVDAQQNQLAELLSYKDAILLGVFN